MCSGRNHLKDLSHGISSDLSREAIARRLQIASELWKAVNELGRKNHEFITLKNGDTLTGTIENAAFPLLFASEPRPESRSTELALAVVKWDCCDTRRRFGRTRTRLLLPDGLEDDETADQRRISQGCVCT